jgi:hypothetical protein
MDVKTEKSKLRNDTSEITVFDLKISEKHIKAYHRR